MNSIEHRLTIAGKTYRSRLLVGTGKYRDFAETRAAIDASGAEIITVAIRRVNIGQNSAEPNLLDALPVSEFTILPNTVALKSPMAIIGPGGSFSMAIRCANWKCWAIRPTSSRICRKRSERPKYWSKRVSR